MKIIILDKKHGATRSIVLKGWMRGLLGVFFLGLPVVFGYGTFQWLEGRQAKTLRSENWQNSIEALNNQSLEITRVREEALSQLQALTIRLAGLQARLIRLDALGERLIIATGIEADEFDFKTDPQLGGPSLEIVGQNEDQMIWTDFFKELELLSTKVEERQQKFNLLDYELIERNALAEFEIAGKPVNTGYISSNYGRRLDPFNGKLSWHHGVDFATGKTGIEVKAVGAGVVTHAGYKSGFGNLITIDHGNGYETLYAHNQRLKLQVGDVVKRGQVVSLSGSSGRSTGPHVHFEVHKNGRAIDPSSYLRRTIQ
jgi:murein DD-endopeptidase MepM/ murein hydrolase activator NlpD